MKVEDKNTGEIIIYKESTGPVVEVSFVNESVWLNQQQIAQLFGTQRSAITKHLNNIFKSSELSQNSVCSILEHTATDGKKYKTKFYNLDAIVSVGYRVNSIKATNFRIWATNTLNDYLLKGYAINKDRLNDQNLAKVKELQSAVQLIQTAIRDKKLEGYEKEVLNIITDYTNTWTALYQYDKDSLQPESTTKRIVSALDYDKIKKSVERFRDRLIKDKQASNLFGKEVGDKLKGLLGNIEQSFSGKQLYNSLEEKAAHLLYFAIKDHPFADGNKRIGSLMFILYLVENNRIYNKRGEKIINDTALTALALLIAESKPNQKEVMVNLVASLIVKN